MAAESRDADGLLRGLYDAFNARDLALMLAVLHPDIELQPLRLSGTEVWRGHAAIAELHAQMAARRLSHHMRVDAVRPGPDGRFVVLGAVDMDGESVAFVGLHTLQDGLVRKTEHRFATAETLQVLGLD